MGVFKLSKRTGPIEAKFYVAPPWVRGKDGKLIQMIEVISLLSTPGSGAFSRDFTTNTAPQCRTLKSPTIPWPQGGVIQMTGDYM